MSGGDFNDTEALLDIGAEVAEGVSPERAAELIAELEQMAEDNNLTIPDYGGHN